MHFIPDNKLDKSRSFYTPKTDKFAGYAQFPYQLQK